jgi:hypothetical protein
LPESPDFAAGNIPDMGISGIHLFARGTVDAGEMAQRHDSGVLGDVFSWRKGE